MKASKFSDAQKAFIIKPSEEGTPVAGISRKAGIGQPTCFDWTKKHAGFLPTEMKQIKEICETGGRYGLCSLTARAGVSTSRKSIAFTVGWACSSGTRRRNRR